MSDYDTNDNDKGKNTEEHTRTASVEVMAMLEIDPADGLPYPVVLISYDDQTIGPIPAQAVLNMIPTLTSSAHRIFACLAAYRMGRLSPIPGGGESMATVYGEILNDLYTFMAGAFKATESEHFYAKNSTEAKAIDPGIEERWNRQTDHRDAMRRAAVEREEKGDGGQ